jgi:hypothetical protein
MVVLYTYVHAVREYVYYCTGLFLTAVYNLHTRVTTHCKERNFDLCISRKGTARPQSQFPIDGAMSVREMSWLLLPLQSSPPDLEAGGLEVS